jgi:UDP-glucose 4-epimerase
MSLRDMIRQNRRFTVPVPLSWLCRRPAPGLVADTGRRRARLGRGLRHSLVLDTRRARDELGWTPRRDTLACVSPKEEGERMKAE